MKLLKMAVLGVCLLMYGYAYGAEAQWAEIKRGETKGDYRFGQDGGLVYKGRAVSGFKTEADEVGISPPAPGGRYAVCVTFDDLDSKAAILQLDNCTAVLFSLEAPPMVWTSWSPDGKYAVLGSYYESDMKLYSVSLSPVNARPLPIKVRVKTDKEGTPLEYVRYDTDKLTWTKSQTFQVVATVHCNPYADNRCTEEKSLKAVSRHLVEVNAESLHWTVKKIR